MPKKITMPRRISTPVRRLDPRIRQLEATRLSTGLTAEQQAALDEMYRDAEAHALSEQDVDRLAEEHAEGRRAHYHDLPIARNFHE